MDLSSRLKLIKNGELPKGMSGAQADKYRGVLLAVDELKNPQAEPELPGALTQLKNAGNAILTNARSGLAKAPENVVADRLAICEACPDKKLRQSDRRCAECSCYVDIKTQLAAEECPLKHWTAVEVPQRKKSSAVAAAKSGKIFHPMPFSQYRAAFTPATAKARFIKLEQFGRDIQRLASIVPPDVTTIAGVSRSGMYPATMVAMLLHLPLLVVRHHQGDIVPGGNGWRLKEGAPKNQGRTLFIDDTTMTGNSLKRTQFIAREKKYKDPLFASVYVNPAAKAKPDLWVVDLPWPHLLEWNLFNSILMDSCAFDMDGILCHDCPASDDDDGSRYLEWMQSVAPLYLVRKRRIRTIITARLEKYRPQTLAWLSRWRIKHNDLVMGPWSTNSERRGNVVRWKTQQVQKFAKNGRNNKIKPIMYIESDHRLAKAIASGSGVLTVCPATAECFGDPTQSGKRRRVE